MIHQQPLLPPQEPKLHISHTSKEDLVTAFAVHSMLFRQAEKVRPEKIAVVLSERSESKDPSRPLFGTGQILRLRASALRSG